MPTSIVALGARTPLGLFPASAAAAVRAGVTRIREHAFFADEDCEPLRGATDARLDPALMGWERLAALAQAAVDQVAAELVTCPPDAKIAMLVAGPEHRPGWSTADERQLLGSLARHRLGGRPIVPSVAARGHAGALHAIGQAMDLLDARVVDVAVVCGVDSYFDPQTARWLLENRQWLRPGVRSGFFPGEAAGALALSSASTTRALRLREHARVTGAGSAQEPERIKTDSNNLGIALADAIERSIARAGGIAAPIDTVLCDINGERYRTEEWGFTVLRTQSAFADPTAYLAPTDLWGDVGAASGVLLTMLAVQGWQRQHARGPRALVFAGSEAGLRAAVLLEQARS